jgi:hypothetical protein
VPRKSLGSVEDISWAGIRSIEIETGGTGLISLIFDHPLLLSITLFLLLTATVEAGFRLALVTRVHDDDDRHEQIAISRDSLGILLSLLLGFTLAMALPHYDLRKQLIMEEANAIGTTGLRATLLPEPHKIQVRALLLQYVEARESFSQADLGQQEFASALDRTKSLQSALWDQAKAVAQQSPTPMTSLFITSLNDTIDLSEKRQAALEKRIPPSIWLLLALISMLTCLTFGYGQRRRFWMVAVISPLMVAIVMGLIADLDSPRSGFLREDLRSLKRLSQELKSETSAPAVLRPASQ